jgi:2-phospho-L-lactate/phosphoenolpyruvate guanylyltransferase
VSSKRARTGTIVEMTTPTDWRLVVPVKGGANAKSRLHPPPGVAREDLALALAADCLTACLAGMPPARVLVVTSDKRATTMAVDLGVRVVPDPGTGLDGAVRAARDLVLAEAPGAALAVLLGDLPALRAGDLAAALGAAAAYPLAVVPDASGTGTVLLTATAAAAMEPSFGEGSAQRHEAGGHHRLDLDLPALRTDVDDDQGLATAVRLGVGEATRAVLEGARATLPAMQATVHRFDEASGAGSVLLDDGREVGFTADTFAASALRHLRWGQRLSVAVDDAGQRVTKLWIVGIGDDQAIG